MGIKTVNGIVKKNQQQFSKVCTLIVHRNDVKTLKTLQWNNLPVARGFTSLEHFDVISYGR